MRETKEIQKRMTDTFGLGNPINKEVAITYLNEEADDAKGSKKLKVCMLPKLFDS